MTKRFIIRDTNSGTPFWASDENIMDAIKRYKRLTGKLPSNKASIVMFDGLVEDLEEILIDDLGMVNSPRFVAKTIIN